MNYEPYLEKLIQHYTTGDYEPEVQEAKKYFLKSAGVFDEESVDLEMKMLQFTDWYLMTRPLSGKVVPPSSYCLDDEKFTISEEEERFFQNISHHRHSLFSFIKVKGDDVHIKDLFSGYKLVLEKSPVVVGFDKNEIFETRLIPHEDSFVFSTAFCIHPAGASKYILQEVKALLKNKDHSFHDRDDLMFRLFKMRHKIEQYKHIRLEQIYTNDPKLKV